MGDDKMQWRMHTCIVAMFKITFLSAGRIPTIVRVVFLLRYSALFAIHCYLFLLFFVRKCQLGRWSSQTMSEETRKTCLFDAILEASRALK